MKFQDMTRKQMRYILFRVKDAQTEEQFTYRAKKLPIRRVVDRESPRDAFAKGEAANLFESWGLDPKSAEKAIKELTKHIEAQPNFSGWRFFAEPNGVFQAWDLGIEDADTKTKSARPEKAWLFGQPQLEVCLRGLRQDGETALEKETGLKAKPVFEMEA